MSALRRLLLILSTQGTQATGTPLVIRFSGGVIYLNQEGDGSKTQLNEGVLQLND